MKARVSLKFLWVIEGIYQAKDAQTLTYLN